MIESDPGWGVIEGGSGRWKCTGRNHLLEPFASNIRSSEGDVRKQVQKDD